MPPLTISVITVVRNGHQFIEQTIKSVIGQGYDHLEYIVIDGASTDGTIDIIKSHESEITRWISETDKGISDAFNKGLSLATGNYMLFLNADDHLANSDVMEAMADKIIENNFPRLIYGDCDVMDRNSGRVSYRASIEFSPHGLKHGLMPPHPSLFIHRDYFDKYGLFDTRFRIAMDYELFLRGALREKVIHVPLLATCVRGGGLSTLNHSVSANEIIEALKKNGHIHSRFSEFKLRKYFFLRAFARSVLIDVGLYNLFFDIRNRRGAPRLRGLLSWRAGNKD